MWVGLKLMTVRISFQDVKLANTKHFKYFDAWISYNKFTIGENKFEYRIDYVIRSFDHC